MKKFIALNPHTLILSIIPVSLFLRMDSATTNLRNGDIAGAALELLNIFFGSQGHKYQNNQANLSMPAELKMPGYLILSFLAALGVLTTAGSLC